MTSPFVEMTDAFVSRVYNLYHVKNRQTGDDILLDGFKLGEPVELSSSLWKIGLMAARRSECSE
jgi:hypothetical protein